MSGLLQGLTFFLIALSSHQILFANILKKGDFFQDTRSPYISYRLNETLSDQSTYGVVVSATRMSEIEQSIVPVVLKFGKKSKSENLTYIRRVTRPSSFELSIPCFLPTAETTLERLSEGQIILSSHEVSLDLVEVMPRAQVSLLEELKNLSPLKAKNRENIGRAVRRLYELMLDYSENLVHLARNNLVHHDLSVANVVLYQASPGTKSKWFFIDRDSVTSIDRDGLISTPHYLPSDQSDYMGTSSPLNYRSSFELDFHAAAWGLFDALIGHVHKPEKFRSRVSGSNRWQTREEKAILQAKYLVSSIQSSLLGSESVLLNEVVDFIESGLQIGDPARRNMLQEKLPENPLARYYFERAEEKTMRSLVGTFCRIAFKFAQIFRPK